MNDRPKFHPHASHLRRQLPRPVRINTPTSTARFRLDKVAASDEPESWRLVDSESAHDPFATYILTKVLRLDAGDLASCFFRVKLYYDPR